MSAHSLVGDDQVVLEATGNALAIARVVEPYVAPVVLANPKSVKAATETAKTDKIDARTIAKLLAGSFLREVWIVFSPCGPRRRGKAQNRLRGSRGGRSGGRS